VGTLRPPVVRARAPEVAHALADGGVVAVPGVCGYLLVSAADGEPGHPDRLAVLAGTAAAGAGALVPAAASPAGSARYLVGDGAALGALCDEVGDELAALVARCWPGPVEVLARRQGATVQVGQPEDRALRRLCRALGPWRAEPLSWVTPDEVAAACDPATVACVVDGGARDGPPATLVDATATPLRVVRSGALPDSFVEAALLMHGRRRGRRRRGAH
jgi:hypothetical protein